MAELDEDIGASHFTNHRMNAEAQIRLQVTADASLLVVIRDTIVTLAKARGFSSDACGAIELAVDEACANSMDAATRNQSPSFVDLEIQFTSTELIVTVLDDGEDYRDNFERELQMERDALRYKTCGYGLQIIRTLMDQVRYERQGDRNRLTMVKLQAPKEG